MPNKRRLMIDTETTALGADAGLWQIGYWEMGGPFEGLVYLNPYTQTRDINPDTVKWLEENTPDWNRMQDIFPTLDSTYAVLRDFHDMIKAEEFDEVWCKGSDFDFAIMRSIYNQFDIPLPWHYRKQCCMRTFLNTFPEFKIKFGDGSMAHNALNDSRQQGECVIRVLKHISRY